MNREVYQAQVANVMMRGVKFGRLTATQKQKDNFLQQHKQFIDWTNRQLPVNVRVSAAIPAVITKCLYKYDKNIVLEFCKALRGNFRGQNDPAFLLWKFLSKQHGKNTTEVYQYTVCAAKAFMEGRSLNSLSTVRVDIFEWDEGWTVPDNLLANWNLDGLPEVDEDKPSFKNKISKVGFER